MPGAVMARSVLEKGMAAYESGRYGEAVTLLDSVARTQGVSASLLFDLANSYYHVGDLGNARLYLERARKLDPSDKRIKRNIEYIESKTEDANKAEMRGKKISVSPEQESFFASINRVIAQDSSSNFWAVLSVSSFLLMIAALSVYLFTRNVAARKVGFFGSIVLFILSGCFLIFSFMSAGEAMKSDSGVVMAFKVQLRSEPRQSSDVSSAVLTRGSKLYILDEEADVSGNVSWYKVRLNSDNVGWIPAGDFRQI